MVNRGALRTCTSAAPPPWPRPPVGRGCAPRVVPAEVGLDSWSGMAENGALATTVGDLAVAHAVLAGDQPTAPYDPGRPLRIAVSTRSPVYRDWASPSR